MVKRLTEAQIEHYSREGYVSPVEALSSGEAAGHLARLEAFEAEHGMRFGRGHFDDEPCSCIDFGEAERAFHAAAVERFKASNTEQTRRYAEAGTP